jgi:hypothetical protein
VPPPDAQGHVSLWCVCSSSQSICVQQLPDDWMCVQQLSDNQHVIKVHVSVWCVCSSSVWYTYVEAFGTACLNSRRMAHHWQTRAFMEIMFWVFALIGLLYRP